MKKIFTLSSLLIITCILISAFSNSDKTVNVEIYERNKQRFQAFADEVERFSKFLPDNETTTDQLQSRFLLVREKYKAWEYLAAYTDADFINRNVNGAPLPKLLPNAANMEIVEPSGMQVLDELLFSGDFEDNRNEIIIKTMELRLVLDQYAIFDKAIYDRTVFDAVRQEMIRLLTLGLTGFDVPASGNSIPDAITVLNTMNSDLKLYKKLFNKVDAQQADKLYNTFDAFIYYLEQHNDFDNLDRLYVLKAFINPIYATMLDLHKKSGVEMDHEVMQASMLPPINHLSENIFANDFLDPYKYTRLSPSLSSPEMIDLGRLLFFDPVMSKNLKRSCASCHHPDKAFTDGQPKSIALDFDGKVDRNAPTLINCVYSERLFHDMRATSLEGQIDHVLSNRKEFDMSMLDIVKRLKQSEEYTDKFNRAFVKYSGEKIDPATVAFAISAYVSSLRGFNSEFDKYVRGETSNVSSSVRNGFNLFMGKGACGTCHFAPVFNGTVPPVYIESESEVLGVPEDPYAKTPKLDPDRGRIEGRLKEPAPFFEFSFKTPTVRNVAATAPYMHNGAYKTLEDVVDFYNNGGGAGIGINIEHQTLPFDSLSLKKQEVKDIVAFMEALTDTTGMTSVPATLPVFASKPEWNTRKVGGEY